MSGMTLQAQAINRIIARDGRVTPGALVDDARPEDSLTHDAYPWDNEFAGEEWRKHIASGYIRAVTVTWQPDEKREPFRVRAYLPTKEEPNAYRPVAEIMADEVLSQVTMQRMKREWQALRRRYQQHEAFWQMIAAESEVKGKAAA